MEIIQKCKDFLETHYKLITIAGLLVIFLFVLIFGSVLVSGNKEEDFVFADTEFGKSIVQVTETGANKSKLTVPNGVKYIGRGAFLNSLTTLVELNLPSSLEIIENAAAPGLQNLERLNFASSSKLKSIGVGAFESCIRLKTVNFPAKTENGFEIKHYAFQGCVNLQEVKNLNNAISLGSDMFENSKIKDIQLSTKLKTIPSNAFRNLYLTEIEIPSSVESIGEYAFSGNASLTKVVFHEGLKNIMSNAFYKSRITELNLPSSVESIGEYAFSGNASLTKVVFHEGLKNIKSNAFYGSGITELNFPSSIETISSSAFAFNKQLESVTFADNSNLKSLWYSVFENCIELKSVNFPTKSVNEIILKNSVFDNCDKLDNVYLGESVTELGYAVFKGVKSVKTITLPSSIKKVASDVFFEWEANQTIIIDLPKSASNNWDKSWNNKCNAKIVWKEV